MKDYDTQTRAGVAAEEKTTREEIAALLDPHADRHRLPDLEAVVVHEGLRLVDAVRDVRRVGAGQGLGLLVYIRNVYFIVVNGRQVSATS